MAHGKYDGVIEAVRYLPAGKIDFVRAYERVGAAFSDRVLLQRDQLMERLKQGKRFVTGTRKEFLAGTFETGMEVTRVMHNDKEIITTSGQDGGRDYLEAVPRL